METIKRNNQPRGRDLNLAGRHSAISQIRSVGGQRKRSNQTGWSDAAAVGARSGRSAGAHIRASHPNGEEQDAAALYYGQGTEAAMADLAAAWTHRNTLAEALDQTLDWVGRELRQASAAELIDFLGGFAPARAAGPEWTGSFERLVEQMWEQVAPGVLAEIQAEFRQRGPIWAPVANSFLPANGERLRERRWHPTGARRAAVVLR